MDVQKNYKSKYGLDEYRLLQKFCYMKQLKEKEVLLNEKLFQRFCNWRESFLERKKREVYEHNSYFYIDNERHYLKCEKNEHQKILIIYLVNRFGDNEILFQKCDNESDKDEYILITKECRNIIDLMKRKYLIREIQDNIYIINQNELEKYFHLS